MQKLFSFELATAIKDRSKPFQVVTLAVLSFCLTVIVISFVTHFTAPAQSLSAKQQKKSDYAGLHVADNAQIVVQK